MRTEKMNIGIIGCGGFVQGNHLPNAHRNPNFRIRALCDLNEKLLEPLRDRYSPDYVTKDYLEIAFDQGIEAVIIGTSPSVRVEPIRAMAEKGKHIYVEKPMSLGYDDSKEIIEIIKKTGVKLQVGFNRPYSKIMQEAKRIFKKIRKGPTLIYYRIVGEFLLWPKFHQEAVASGRSITIIHETTHILKELQKMGLVKEGGE
jgi:myo-inositol 2-dehydrogenase/D-chiro-inositol 1-dehydrogenase